MSEGAASCEGPAMDADSVRSRFPALAAPLAFLDNAGGSQLPDSVIAAMHDCQVMLCGGMGFRAAQDLQANGIQAIMVDATLTPDQAVADMVAGKLKPGQAFCRCHH